MNNNTSSNSPILYSDGGGVLNSGKIKIEGTSGKSYNLDDFSTVASCPFPVGFGGFFQTDPNSIYSGTKWEQKKDVFILAAGTVYPAGSTGGEAQHVLTVDEMPSHNHQLLKETGSQMDSGGKLKAVDGNYYAWANPKNDNLYYWWSNTCKNGGSQPHNNMPPYFAMPFWIRTA